MSVIEDSQYQQGLSCLLSGQYDHAVAAFQDVYERSPDDPQAIRELGLAYARRGESVLPSALKERDIDSKPVQVDESVRNSLGSAIQAALGLAVVQASKLVGKTDWIVRYREDFRLGSELLSKAGPIFDEMGTPDAEVYFALASCFRYLGRSTEARDAARRAVEIAPTVSAYVDRARVIDRLSESGISIDPSLPKWADVILPVKTKRELRQMQLMLEDPKLAQSLGVEPPTGLLLYGPPGTGKTTIARVLANEAKCKFFATSPAEINTMWLGESEKQVKRLFDQARAGAPSIIFIDEIDALLPSRSGGVNMYSDKVVNQFLHEMDGLRANRGVFVVGATNRRDMLDPALLRGGRLSREIEIPLPDHDGRIELFKLYLRGTNISPEITAEDLAARANNFTGASIRALVNEAGLQALIRLAEASEGSHTVHTVAQVTQADFDEALANFASSKPDPGPNPYDSMRRFFN